MQNLSLDDIFCVMEFLPTNDLANALMTCREWYSLDQFEPFWKTILQHYLCSNIILQFGKMFRENEEVTPTMNRTSKNIWNLQKVKKILKTGDAKEKKALISYLRSLKPKKTSGQFTTDRSILNTYLTAYDSHILQDRTASRESLKKFIIHNDQVESTSVFGSDEGLDEFDNEEILSESNRPTVIGKRFKYLMEKQLYSKRTVIISTFFNIHKHYSYHRSDEAFILSLLSACLGREYKRSEKCSEEGYQLGKEAFSLFFKYHEQIDNADKWWSSILHWCITNLNEFVKVEEYEEVLKKLLQVKCTFSIEPSLIEYIYFKIDCRGNGLLPLIRQIIEKNRVNDCLSNAAFMYQCMYETTNSVDELKFAQQVAEYFNYLEKFQSCEHLLQHYRNDFIILSMGRLSDTYTDEFLRLYPIDLESVSFYDCARYQVTDKMLTIANSRGINYPLESVEQSIIAYKYYTYSSYKTIKYIMEHYNLDIYDVEKRTRFFSNFLGSIIRYGTEELKSNIEEIFSNSPMEWKKLASIHDDTTNEITDQIHALVRICCERPSGEDLHYLRECFTPNIFDLDVMARSLSNATPECALALYNLTMYSEDEKLSDHVDRMLEEQDWSNFTCINFANYDPSDPAYLVAVYRFVHQ